MNGRLHDSQWEKRRWEGKADFLWRFDRQRALNTLGLTRDVVMSIRDRSTCRRVVTYVSPACLVATNRIIWLALYERRRSMREELRETLLGVVRNMRILNLCMADLKSYLLKRHDINNECTSWNNKNYQNSIRIKLKEISKRTISCKLTSYFGILLFYVDISWIFIIFINILLQD